MSEKSRESVWRLTNPSDDYTFVTSDRMLAAMTSFLLGSGLYPAEVIEGEDHGGIPLFLGGALKWFKDTFGLEFDEAMKQRRGEVATVLRTVLIGTLVDRKMVESALQRMPESEHASFLDEYKDRKRSSMNNIGARAEQMALHFAKP